jgi:hypothetical protein
MIEGSGSGAGSGAGSGFIPLTNGSGSKGPKNIRNPTDPDLDPQHWLSQSRKDFGVDSV